MGAHLLRLTNGTRAWREEPPTPKKKQKSNLLKMEKKEKQLEAGLMEKWKTAKKQRFPTFPQALQKPFNRTDHLLQKPDTFIC